MFYKNLSNNEILTEQEYEEKKQKDIEYLLNDKNNFNKYLRSSFKPCEIFDFSDDDRIKASDNYHQEVTEMIERRYKRSYRPLNSLSDTRKVEIIYHTIHHITRELSEDTFDRETIKPEVLEELLEEFPNTSEIIDGELSGSGHYYYYKRI